MNSREPTLSSPFAISNIRLFIAFRIFFNARFYYPVFTILFIDFGLTVSQFALMNAVWAATIVIMEVPSGALADIWGRRNNTAVIPTFSEMFAWARDERGMQAIYLDVKFAEGQVAEAEALVGAVWNEWQIDLQTLADQGVNLQNISRLIIGIGGQIDGSGTLFIDDIGLHDTGL